MKVILVPYTFYPDPPGGTEVYVESLARHLQEYGMDVVVAAPGQASERYQYTGLRVVRFATQNEIHDLQELYNEGDNKAAAEFALLLDEEKPDIVHLHALTPGVSLRVVREVKKRGIPVVFTYHTPTVSCQNGMLLRWGKDVCDGKLNARLCTACTLHSIGVWKALAGLISYLPEGISGAIRLKGKVWTAARMHGLIALRHNALRDFLQEVDKIIILCDWMRDVLLLNGVPLQKMVLIRHGIQTEEKDKSQAGVSLSAHDTPLRLIYLGRLNPTKGLHVLIAALKLIPRAPLKLHIYGIIQGEEEFRYQESLVRQAEGDERIKFMSAVTHENVSWLLKGYHFLVAPSLWLETGPLVVLEAHAAGIPVIGSQRGGLAELLQHGVNGMLVEADSVQSWASQLERLCHDRELLVQLRKGIGMPRSMKTVAQEVAGFYQHILQEMKETA